MEQIEPAIIRALDDWPKLFGYAVSLCAERGRAEDLCQATFERLLSRASRIDMSRPLLPLLVTMLRNLYVSELRRPRSVALDDPNEAGSQQAADPRSIDPSELAEQSDTLEAVRAALARLPENWRAAVYMRDALDFSYREIAEALSTSADTVRTLLHRARHRLRGLLSERTSSG